LLLAVGRGFEMLKNAGEIDRLPTLVGVQASACAPLWAVFTAGSAGLGWVTEGQTRAEGVRIKHPLRGDAVLQAIDRSAGKVVAVEENEIIPGRDHLARLGFFVEPTSAIVWGALKQVAGFVPEPIVVILTGSGFKAIS
jgi:threonine synthase